MKTLSARQRLALSLPVVSILLLVLGCAALVPHDLAPTTPPLFLTAIFFWTVYTPRLVPLPLIFLSGLFADVVTGLPLGVMALTSLILTWVSHNQRRFLIKQSFFRIWWIFTSTIAPLFLLLYLGLSLYYFHLFDWRPITIQLAATILLYPLIHWCFYAALPTIPDEAR